MTARDPEWLDNLFLQKCDNCIAHSATSDQNASKDRLVQIVLPQIIPIFIALCLVD